MATPEQVQELITLMKQQMDTVNELREENDRLRAANAGAAENQCKLKKPERPVVNANIDDREWALFEDSWGRYKKMCKLSDNDVENIRLELRACCSSNVNKFLFEYVGPTKLNVERGVLSAGCPRPTILKVMAGQRRPLSQPSESCVGTSTP